MRILAVDTALGLCSAAVMDTATGHMIARESLMMDRGHAEALMPLIDRVMAQVPGGFSSLSRVATTVGPGRPFRLWGSRRSPRLLRPFFQTGMRKAWQA